MNAASETGPPSVGNLVERSEQPGGTAVAKAIVSMTRTAVDRSIRSRVKVTLFALGFPIGLLVSTVVISLLAMVYPVTAPMALFWTISIAFASALLLSRVPLYGVFTSEEARAIERIGELYTLEVAAIDDEERRLMACGTDRREIEAQLSPKRDEVAGTYREELAKIRGTSSPALPPGDGGRRPPPARDSGPPHPFEG